MHILYINGMAYFQEALNVSGVDEDIAIEDLGGEFLTPTFHQIHSRTGDILAFFKVPQDGFKDLIRVKLEKDDEDIERASVEYYQAKDDNGKISVLTYGLDYDSNNPQPDDITLTAKFIDDKVSLDEQYRGEYRVFCLQCSVEKSDLVIEAVREEKKIPGLNVITEPTEGGTKIVVTYDDKIFPFGYNLRGDIMSSIAVISENAEGTISGHIMSESKDEDGFTVLVPLNISSFDIRRHFRSA